MGTRRKFSRDLSINQVAKDLGVWTIVDKWVDQAAADSDEKPEFMTTAEREELAGLRRENRTLKMEREILKKSSPRTQRE